ncbi:MAG: hypothetical protein WD906_02600 [Anaerolineales bacterium]
MNQEYVLWQMARDRQAELRSQADAERKLREAGIDRSGPRVGLWITTLGAVTLAVLMAAERAAAAIGGGGGAGPVPFM